MEVSEALGLLGEPGVYQALLYFCLWVCNSTVALNHLIMAVYKYTPPHRCALPSNVSVTTAIPVDDSCHIYIDYNSTLGTKQSCPQGWHFDLQGGETSISSEWSLVCEEKYLVGTATTVYFAGVMIGGAVFGQLSDRFGRKPVLLMCMYGHIALGVGIHFVPTYDAFVALRFFLGFLIQGIQTTSYVLLIEMTVPKFRPWCAGIFEVFWALGNLWMALLAWAIKDWRQIQLALCLPSLITLVYIFFVPESVRWLVLQNKTDKAAGIIRRMAKFNKASIPDDLDLYATGDSKKHDGANYSFTDLFRTKGLCKRTILMGYIWLATSIGYYGLTLSAGGLAGDRFENLFISAAVETLAFTAVIFVLKFLSRRRPLMLYYVLGGVTCIIAGSIPKSVENSANISKGFAVFGKLFISAGFSTIFLFTVELFPTVIRSIGMGSCVFWARVGGMIAPQILLLGKYTFKALPSIIFGTLSLIAAIATFFVPETRGIKLPQTIEEIEETRRPKSNTEELNTVL